MTLTEIRNKIAEKRNGTMVRISYKSDIPVKDEFKDSGYTIIKLTTSTMRTGISYKKDPAKEASNTKPRQYNHTWNVINKIYTNNNNGMDYVRFFTMKHGMNTKTQYVIIINDTIVDVTNYIPTHFIKDTYLNKNVARPELKDIRLENILYVM